MSSASMSLKTLQYLLQYMDANRRFEISNRCPALHAIEKSVPLKIESLTLMGNGVIVNDTTYELGIIRKYNNGEAPDYVTASNKGGGLSHEVDRFGIRDKLDKYTVTPGDVGINLPREPRMQNEDEDIRSLENQIQRYQVQLAQERRLLRNRRNVYRLEITIEVARAKIFEYQCRRENVPPNFEHFLQLTTSRTVDEQDQKTIQRYNHSKKYSEAIKQLTTVLFGDRSSPIYVTKFTFFRSQGVIRLPIGLKFHVEKLKLGVGVGRTLEALAPIFHESSFPLKKLDNSPLSVGDATNPIVRAAGTLKIMIVPFHILQLVSVITNPVVFINMIMLSEQVLEELIEKWIELKRPIGTEHTISLIQREPGFADEMEDILKRFSGVPIDDENVIVPMSDDAHLKISYGSFPEFAPRCKWAIKLLSEAVEKK